MSNSGTSRKDRSLRPFEPGGMLSTLTRYACVKGLPYEFVEWALDTYGFDCENYGSDLTPIAVEWRSQNLTA